MFGLTACGSADTSNPRNFGLGPGGISAFGGASGMMGTGGVGGVLPAAGGVGGALPMTGGGGGAPPVVGGAGGMSLPAGGAGGVGGGLPTGGMGGVAATGGATGSTFPPVTDFTAAGTFTTMMTDVTAAACTIFRPTVLGEQGRRHPVIVWGNGTFNTPSNYTALFNHFASQGFIVAAADTSNAGSGKEMITCLEYVLAQNAAAGSPFEGHVDVDHLASSGYSQGGAGSLMAGLDPRFTVTAGVSPYVVLSLGGFDSASIAKQTHPMFMISGSADTVAVPAQNQATIYSTAKVPIVWATHAGSSHLEVLNAGGGAYSGPLTAWFRYKLMGDASAGQWFETPPCTLCTAPGWTVQSK